ncbi:MAG: YlbF family regulator [Planctomycetota bacterium]
MTDTSDPSDTPAVLEAAQRLGTLIAKHPATQKLEGLLKQLDGDTDAQRLMNDLNRHRQTLADKQTKGEPIEVEDKHKLETLQQNVAGNAILRELQMAQMDYVDLMRKVDGTISPGMPR